MGQVELAYANAFQPAKFVVSYIVSASDDDSLPSREYNYFDIAAEVGEFIETLQENQETITVFKLEPADQRRFVQAHEKKVRRAARRAGKNK